MKKIFTTIFLLIFLHLSSVAQQPVMWMIEGNGTSPSSSWAAVNYDASSSIVNGIWNLYQPKQAATEPAKNCFVQYNPGYTNGVSNSSITTDRSQLRYFIISLKNNTANTTATFYYRVNPTTAAPSGSYKAFPFTITANDTEFKQYVIDLNDIADWDTYFSIMPLFRVDIPNVALPVYTAGGTPALIASIDYLGFSGTSTLPVNLSGFNGKRTFSGIKLNWTTVSENNNSHFEILRSQDGKTFQKIGSVPGNGTSTISHTYSFTDENAQQGTNYYQLNQVDFNGDQSSSKIIMVNSDVDKGNLSFSDSGNSLKISAYSKREQSGKLIITDMLGKNVFEQSFQLATGQNSFQVVGLASGVYVATLLTDEIVRTKFIKR